MDAIQKHELARGEAKTIRLSLMATPVRVAVKDGNLCMWVREPKDALARKPRIFVALPSGEAFSRDYAHVGSCEEGQHTWHVLEVL